MAGYLTGNDPIGDTPIFDFHDYGRKGKGEHRQVVDDNFNLKMHTIGQNSQSKAIASG